jgi:hypothetical protein
MTPCTPAPPCDAEFPLLCEPLELTSNGKRILVEDSAACQKTLSNPTITSILSYDTTDNKLKWITESTNTYPAGAGVLSRELPTSPVAWITGTAGQFLKINSSGFPQFQTETPTSVKWVTVNSNATIVSGQQIFADTTSGAFTLTLPASPPANSFAVIADRGGVWATNNLTIGRNGQTIDGLSQDLVCNISGKMFTIIFNGVTWKIFTV